MKVEFDPEKDLINRDKHGVSLEFGARVFDDPDRIVIGSARPRDGEQRRKAIGLVEGQLWTAVHVVRDGATRFISVRRSNDGEARGYRRDRRGPEGP